MRMKKILALILASLIVFSPAAPTALAAEDLTLLPIKDGYAAMTDSPNSNETLLEIGYHSGSPLTVDTGYAGGSNRGELMYARDVLLSFGGGDIQAKAVSSAVLRLTIAEAKNMGTADNQCVSVNIAAYETSGGWDEDSHSWSNAPEAGVLAGVSNSVTTANCSPGTAVEIDLTDYIRSHPDKDTYDFRLKASGAGFNFYSKENSTPAYRPVLDIRQSTELMGSESAAGEVLADTYTENSNENRGTALEGGKLMTVSADKETAGDNGALYLRNGYIKVRLPRAGAWYDRALIVLRADSTDNADLTVSAFPMDAGLDLAGLTFANSPEIKVEAAAAVSVPDSESSILNYFTLDIADYVNHHPNDDGVYVFALTADTAIVKFHTSEADIEASRPVVSCIFRDRASVNLHYVDSAGGQLRPALSFDAPVGMAYTPENIPSSIDGLYYSSEATADRNSFPYSVKEGANDVYLVYEDKVISGYEAIEIETIQYEQPSLPDHMTVYFEGGSDESYPVAWAEVPAEKLASPGQITVMGTLQGIEADAVTAAVTVLEIKGIAAPTVTTTVGSYPSLPDTLTATVDGGEEGEEDDFTHPLSVVWNDIDAGSYAEAGSFAVGGTIVSSGSSVQITVLVEDEVTTDDRAATADAYTQADEPIKTHNTEELRITGQSDSNPGASGLTVRRTFLRFDGGGFDPAPKDETEPDPIVTSKVRLWFNRIDNNARVTYKIYAIPEKYDTWTEDGLTWNNAENIVANGEYISSMTVDSGEKNDWLELDVTSYVRAHRDSKSYSFFVESDLCAAYIASKEGEAGHGPTLRTHGYIENAPVTLRYVAEINGEETDIAEPLDLIGKLGNPYDYKGTVPNPIYYPDADPNGIYYYDFTTKPDPPKADELDKNLHLSSLNDEGNVIYARYTRRDITQVEPVTAETWQGVKPELPASVTAVLDNGTKLVRSVSWGWDQVNFTDYSKKGSFSFTGDVEDSDVPAKVTIQVKQAYYGEPSYQSENSFGLRSGASYKLSFDLINTESLPDSLGSLVIKDGDGTVPACDMSESDYMSFLSSFGEGERAEVFFTAPESANSLTLLLPDSVNHTVNYELREILGRGGEMTVHYSADGEEIYSQDVNIAFGEVFSLPEEYFTVLDGAYIVNGIDKKGDLDSLTGSVAVDRDGMNVYLLCAASPAFTIDAEVENVLDADGAAYTRSTVTAYNGTSDDRGAAIIVARFGPDGRLLSVERSNMDIKSGSDRATAVTISEPVAENGYNALLVWNDIAGLMPVTTKIDSRNPTGVSSKPDTGDGILVPAIERSVTATSQQDGNEAVNMLTRDSGTRWSAQALTGGGDFDPETSIPVSAVVDLGDIYDIHTVGLGFYQGKTRRARFSVDLSDDGKDFTTVIQPRYSSGKTNGVEYFTLADSVPARYVRINGYGWKANTITDEGLKETNGDWFSVTAFEAYGGLSDSGGIASETNDFEGLDGIRLTPELNAKAGNWGADALNEMTYTDYTPATGGSLYADIAKTPEGAGFAPGNTALHLYDNVDREGKDGAGSVGAYSKLAIPSERYTIRFKWYVPNTIDGGDYNAQWSGVTLSSGRIKGGADTGNPAALQLRLAPSGKNKMSFNIMRTIVYNEGDQAGLLGTGTAFKAGAVWDVSLDVDSAENSVVVTVSDGTRTESAYVRYNLYNSERTMSQTWTNSSVNYIMFNTGAGGKCEMYIDDFSITPTAENAGSDGNLTFSQNYNEAANGAKIRDKAVADTTSALIRESGQSYTPAYGSMLDVSVATQSKTDGRALYLKDYVAREGDRTKGLGGVFAYVDIGSLSTVNVSKISFDMYAPTAGEYSGFALAHGHNTGGDDQSHPLALQARFSPQPEGMQFNSYPSIQYNKGTWKALVGTGNNRLNYKAVWHFDITVNPIIGNVTVSVTDGSKLSSATINMPTSGEGNFSADWSKTPIDTLIFNTGAGTSSDIYIDNIEVYDTGVEKNSYPAVNGLVRYENEYGTGESNSQGAFLVHAGQPNSRIGIARNQNPYYTRFIERRGLADPDSVSLQVIGQPNCYLVPYSNGEGTVVTVQKYQDTDEFRRWATFNKVTNLSGAGSTAYSYQWYNDHSLYLRNWDNLLKLSKSGDSGVNKACTFHLRNEANNYVSDSFYGSSLSGQWYKGYPWYSNYHNHSAIHRNENVVVGGGRVLLKATKVGSNEWIKNSSGQTGYNDSINGGQWKKYCAYTGVISVNSKVYNKGSYIEGSFKQPNSPRGYWTAFWLNGRDSWPPETDMFEYLSSHGTSTWYTATHGGSEGAGWMSDSSVGNMRTQYNTFAIDWGYNYIKMYVNGNLYFDRDNTSDVAQQKNMYLILNTGIGAWESEPDGTTVWDQGLECQWIRSYQYY